jgi:hypothetical protein
MMSFTYLQQALLDAQNRVYEAQLDDEANQYLDDTKNYSGTYRDAWLNWHQIYRQWRTLYEEVCFPLTAIGVLYDPSIEFLHDDEEVDTPTVKLAAVKAGTVKLPVVDFPRVAA